MTTIEPLVWVYWRGRRQRGELATTTAANVLGVLRGFAQTCGDRPVERIGPADVNRWKATRGHLKPATVATQLSYIAAFGRWLLSEGHTRRWILEGVVRPRRPRSVPRAINDDQLGALWHACIDARDRAMVAAGYGLGLRRAEIAGLALEHWDTLTETVLVARGKGGHQRELPVPSWVAQAWRDYLAVHPASSGPLIRRYDLPALPLAPTTVGRRLSDLMLAAGVKLAPGDGISAHALRHSFASRVQDAAGDLRITQEALGHANLSTTSVYLRRAGTAKLRSILDDLPPAA